MQPILKFCTWNMSDGCHIVKYIFGCNTTTDCLILHEILSGNANTVDNSG